MLGPAATVKEALRLLDSKVPDVALLDVNLRGEMVTPVAERLRARGIPFVLASAYDGAQLAAMGLAGTPQIGKPTNARRLLTALLQAVVPQHRGRHADPISIATRRSRYAYLER